MQIHWSDQHIANAKNAMTVLERARKIQELFQLEMLNRGINPIFRSMFTTSTAMSESEIERTLVEIESTIEYLKPFIGEEAPQLIC